MAASAIIFAGQGAQSVGMGKDLAEAFPACRALFDKANEVLGYDLSRICFEGPMEDLTKSNHCQPAIFVMSMACYTALGQEGRTVPAWKGAAGLSLGEWSALHMAGALTYEDTLRVLEARGRFMQEACEERDGGMVSVIGLPMEALQSICAQTGAEIANLNSAEQTVLSGERAAVQDAARFASEQGAKRAIPLKVAGAFHSSLMASAADRLRKVLESTEIRCPSLPVIANVTGLPHGEPTEILESMVAQVTGSVRWFDSVNWFKDQDVDTYVECGPGKVLTGLIKRIDTDAGLHNIHDLDGLRQTVEALS